MYHVGENRITDRKLVTDRLQGGRLQEKRLGSGHTSSGFFGCRPLTSGCTEIVTVRRMTLQTRHPCDEFSPGKSCTHFFQQFGWVQVSSKISRNLGPL